MIFSDSCNVLSNISKIKEFPFPYAGTFECLPPDIYTQLVKSRPPLVLPKEDFNNKRVDCHANDALKSDTLPSIWRDFISYHTSHDFYLKILDNFEFYFQQFYGLKGMRDYKTAVRFSDDEADIYLDCQISLNTAVKEKSTVNAPHVDNPLELWASLLYMKELDDNAGGDLVLHKCIRPPKFHGKREADLGCIRPVLRIPYSANNYVCFLNSPMSIHSVTEREVTKKQRLMVNISLEFEKGKLFDVR